MSWADDVIWWHCYPLGFVGAEAVNTGHTSHRLGTLTNWLDYLIELGANGLLLAPIFASRTHGYDTLDHFRIDPRLGDEDDFAELVHQARSRGIRIGLDGVFNHVSREHEIVQRAMSPASSSDERAWLRWVGEHPRCFEGSLDLVELNLDHPPVQDYVVRAMNSWLDRGVDGWRLDAAYAPGADCWGPVVKRVKAAHPDCWILAEVIHGDYVDFVRRSGVDSVTQYELWKAVWSSLNDRNFHELAWAVQRHNGFCEVFRPQTFIGNHDVTRIATKLTDVRDLRLAVALLLLLPGIPSIYAGDEQGFTGEKLDRPGGDDAVRPSFPDDPQGLSRLGRHVLEEYQSVLGLRRRNRWLVGASATPTRTTDDTIAIELVSGDQRATLALNASDHAVQVPGSHATLTVDPHDWAMG